MGGGDSSGDTGSDSGDGRSWSRVLHKARTSEFGTSFDDVASYFADDSGPSKFDFLGEGSPMRRLKGRDYAEIGGFGNPFDDVASYFAGDTGVSIFDDFDEDRFKRYADGLDIRSPDFGDGFLSGLFGSDGKSERSLRDLIPSMNTWWNMIGAVIPLMATFATQALGVAAALGSVTVAGAGLIGLGLIGHGDSMAESWANAKQELSDFKSEAFQAIQPAAQEFAPISAKFLDTAPRQIRRVATSMKGLTAYEGTVFSLFRGASEWGAQAVQTFVAHEDAVSQLSKRFSKIIGIGIIDFFRFLVEEAYANQDLLIRLGGIFKNIAIALYNVFLFLSRLITAFSPFIALLATVSGYLNGPMIGGLLAIITLFGAAALATYGLNTALETLSLSGVKSSLSSIWSFVSGLQGMTLSELWAAEATWTLAGALNSLKSAIPVVGTLLAAYGSIKSIQGMRKASQMRQKFENNNVGSSSGYGLGTTVIDEGDTNITLNGNSDSSSVEKIRDTINSENSIRSKRTTPNFG
jgi:hypothetical protein